MLTNKEIRAKSRADMKNKYGYAALTTILLNLVLIGSAIAGFGIGAIVIGGAVMCCYKAFYIDIALGKYNGVNSTYRGFRQFMRAFVASILIALINIAIFFALFLITLILLFITHGSYGDFYAILYFIVYLAAICVDIWVNTRLSFVYYVMNHNVNLSAANCIKRSWEITKGRFWKIIGLKLSFIGWMILGALTLGALGLYVLPYMGTAEANLYLAIAYPDGNYPEVDENGEVVVKEEVPVE